MLNFILMLSSGTIAIAVVVIVVSALVFFALRRKKKKIEEPEPEKESIIRGPGAYIQDKWDENLFTSCQNQKINIRAVKVTGKTEDKDKLIFASSLAYNFKTEDKKALILIIPQIIDAGPMNSHELLIVKSPAAEFYNLKEAILTHLFIFLDRRYAWMGQKTTISLHYIEQDRLNCHMRYTTKDHTRLGALLSDLPGVTNWLKTLDQMEEKGSYDFDIQKEFGVEWIDLLPKIQEVFRQYFTGGVEFMGPN